MIEIKDEGIILYSMKDAAEKLHVGYRSISNYLRDGKLHVYKRIGKKNYISEADLVRFITTGANTEGTIKTKDNGTDK
jgi:predicted site-specific integrase-resolvase